MREFLGTLGYRGWWRWRDLYELTKGGLPMVEWTKLDYKGEWTKTRRKLVSQIHQGTHLGTRKFKELTGKQF